MLDVGIEHLHEDFRIGAVAALAARATPALPVANRSQEAEQD